MSKQNQKGFGAVEAILIFVIIGALVGVGWWVYSRNNKENSNTQSTNNSITNFDECVASGNPVAESYPEQCSANGQTFVNEKSNLVTTLNDNEAVELLKVGDEEKLPADIPDSFKQYMKKLLAKNDDNKKDGCSYIGYRVSKYSNVNVAG